MANSKQFGKGQRQPHIGAPRHGFHTSSGTNGGRGFVQPRHTPKPTPSKFGGSNNQKQGLFGGSSSKKGKGK